MTVPKPALAVVAEQIDAFVDEHDYVSAGAIAHRVLNALAEANYVQVKTPIGFTLDTPAAWVTPLAMVPAPTE